MKLRYLLVLSILLASVATAQNLQLLQNQDFESAELGWTKWPTESQSTMELDRTIAHSGKQSLRVTATSAADRLFACAPSATFEPGKLYRITIHLRKDESVPASAIGFRINWRAPNEGVIKARSVPQQIREKQSGEWTARSGLVMTPPTEPTAQFMLSVENAAGRVWFDDIIIENLGTADNLPIDVWTNQTMGVETGNGPITRFVKHQAANDAFYQSGARYNALVFASAEVEHQLRDLQRTRAYAGQKPDEAFAGRFAAADEQLNRAYLAYIRAFKSKAEADMAAFTAEADKLRATLDTLRADLTRAQRALKPAPALPKELGRQPRSVAPFQSSGKLNRLLYGCWSPTQFSAWEKPFDLEFHSSAPGAPKVHTETEIDFSNITKACDDMQALGYSGTFAYLSFGIHEYMYAPQWLIEKYKDEPDFFKVSQDGLKGPSRGNDHSLNYFHPAVRAYIKDYLTKYATFCKSEPRILFYEIAQEAYPYFSTSKGIRETGYGPHAEAAFRTWLQAKYKTIAAVNQALGTTYADFATIQPPPDGYIGDREMTPLVAVFEAFRDDSYRDYLNLIYSTLKAADPSKPVVARHSALLHLINGADAIETCDVLSYHRGAPQMQVGNVYLNSLNSFHNKGLGYMEDFWGKQEEGNRVDDERAQRRGLEKHISRTAIWGRDLQMKWYSYTSGAYIFEYNGNWFNPQWDLTTVRYCAPGLAVAKKEMENLDWVLTHSQIVPSKVLVLQPTATMRNERPDLSAYSEILGLHDLLYKSGTLYELIPEEYFEQNRARFSDYNVVILPQAKYLSADLQRKLLDFMKPGKLLVTLGESGKFDELGRPCGLLEEKLSPTNSLRADSLAALGNRRLDLWKSIASYATPAASSLNMDIEAVLRVTENGDRYLFLLNRNVDQPAETTVHVRQTAKQAIDVMVPGGATVPFTSDRQGSYLKVRLSPGETTALWLGQ
ncbi:MAG: beta-galactosidase [Armatimonadota bacterium]